MSSTSSPKLLYTDLDWNELWQHARERKSWHSKNASDWDRKAASFAERNINSPYANLFLSRLPLEGTMTVLDVGCGPGTLAIPLAKKVRSVTCIDYSQSMLDLVEQRARENGIRSISTVKCAWEDNWKAKGIEPHDITIASRSMSVGDLKGALLKLNQFARKFVFVTDRITPSPFEPEAFTAIGRTFDPGPDYIYTVNCLYSLGIHPSIDILQLESQLTFPGIEEACSSFRWMFENLTTLEDRKLKEYVLSQIIERNDGLVTIRRNHPPKWALIWWEKGQ